MNIKAVTLEKMPPGRGLRSNWVQSDERVTTPGSMPAVHVGDLLHAIQEDGSFAWDRIELVSVGENRKIIYRRDPSTLQAQLMDIAEQIREVVTNSDEYELTKLLEDLGAFFETDEEDEDA